MKNKYGKIIGSVVLGSSFLFGVATFAQQITPCFPPPSGLVAWYRGENNADDNTGVNNGTLVNGLGFTAGEVAQGFNYTNGGTGYVSISNSTSLRSLTNGFTVETWINPKDLSPQRPIVEWNNGTVPGVHLWINVSAFGIGGTGSIFANLVDASAGDHPIATAANIVTTNEFQHVALTYDKSSGMAKIYLNGVPVLTSNVGSFTPQVSYNLLLGKRLGGYPSEIFIGVLDEVSIYNQALTDCDIQSIYLMGTQGKCQ